MRLKFFHVPMQGDAAVEGEIDQFIQSHKIVSIDREFVQDKSASAWAICVTYLSVSGDAADSAVRQTRRSRVDYKAVLSAEDFHLFVRLRELRSRTFRADGVPAYQIFTDAQLAEMARRRVSSKSELATLEGVGEARVRKYGDMFIAVVRDHDGDKQIGPADSEDEQHAEAQS